MRLIVFIKAVSDLLLSMEGRMGGIFGDFTQLIKDLRLIYNEG